MKNAKAREATKVKKYDKNFYVIDTETGGFPKNEPIQIAVLLFLNGEQAGLYNQYFLPQSKMTESAVKTHGKTRKSLKKLKAKEWTKGQSGILMNFLNTHKDLPIVGHHIEYDRDKVLKPAFEKINNSS